MKKNNQRSQIIIYKSENGQVKIDVRFENETVWLTQNALAELFQTTKQNIGQHIKNILEERELSEDSTVKKFFTVQKEGSREISREIEYYNLDLIISVGYRVKSNIATAFRQWATAHLREYIVKGFVLDDERLKNPDLPFDYFEELTRRQILVGKVPDPPKAQVEQIPTNFIMVHHSQIQRFLRGFK